MLWSAVRPSLSVSSELEQKSAIGPHIAPIDLRDKRHTINWDSLPWLKENTNNDNNTCNSPLWSNECAIQNGISRQICKLVTLLLFMRRDRGGSDFPLIFTTIDINWWYFITVDLPMNPHAQLYLCIFMVKFWLIIITTGTIIISLQFLWLLSNYILLNNENRWIFELIFPLNMCVLFYTRYFIIGGYLNNFIFPVILVLVDTRRLVFDT